MRSRLVLLVGSLLPAAASCTAPSPSSPPGPSASLSSSAPAIASASPPVERECTRDDECAIAHIETSGTSVCCPACAFTPGTRRWHAKLQRFCAKHPQTSCAPLACPMGPTRAVCNAGRCDATHLAPDGGPAPFIVDQERCLPAMVCDDWADCAHVVGNAQDGWFVKESTRVPAGEIAGVENVCTVGRCEGARLFPEGKICPPHTVIPLISAPPYRCELRAGKCERIDPKKP